MTTDPYVGMDPYDAARSRFHADDQEQIAKRRAWYASRLLAPPEPAAAVRVAWAPVVPQPVALTPKDLPLGALLGPDAPTAAIPYPTAGLLYYDQTTGILYQAQEGAP